MRTDRARQLWAAGVVGLLGAVAAVLLRVAGCSLVVGPLAIRWHYFAVAAVFAVVAMATLATRRWVRVLGAGCLVVLTCMSMLTGCALVMSDAIPSLPTRRVDAPGDGPYSLVVRESRDWIDSLYRISVDSRWVIGPGWEVGCVNGDYQDLVDLGWRSPTELTVTVDSGDGEETATVVVSQRTGRVTGRVPDLLRSC